MKKTNNLTSSWFIIFILLFSTTILFIRRSDILLNPQFWAEDGTIFFIQQYTDGIKSFFTPYSGYLHLAPRIIAFLSDCFIPYQYTPIFYVYMSLFLTLFVILNCFSSRLNIKYKWLLALSIVLIPHPYNEVFLNPTNIQWILCVLLILTLMKAIPINRKKWYYDSVIVLICGLTGPFIIFLIPFFILKFIINRCKYNLIILCFGLTATITQLYFILRSPLYNQYNIIFDITKYSKIIGQKIFGSLFLSNQIPYFINPNILCCIFIAFIIFILYYSYKEKQLYNVCIFLSILIFLLSSVFIKFKNELDSLIQPLSVMRYFYIPYLMLTWSIIVCLGRKNKFLILLLILILLSSLLSTFHSKPEKYYWLENCSEIGKKELTINIIPKGWVITIPVKK